MSQKSLHRIPETEDRVLRTLAKVPLGDELPQMLVQLYWAYRNLVCRINRTAVSDEMLAMIVLMSGGNVEPPPAATLFELFKSGHVKRTDDVRFKFRDMVRVGRIEAVDSKRKLVQMREVETDLIREVSEEDVLLDKA